MTEYNESRTVVAPGNRLVDQLYESITRAKEGNQLQRITVVTPSYYSSFYMRRALASRGLVNVEFVRIEDIADLLARTEIEQNRGKPLSRLEFSELVYEAVQEWVESGGAGERLADIALQPSFLSAVQMTITNLEAESGSKKIDFRRLNNADEITKATGDIWATYQGLKSTKDLYDRQQVAGWAIDALEDGILDDVNTQMAIGKLVVLATSFPAPQYRRLWQSLVGLPDSTLVIAATGDERSDALLASEFNQPAIQRQDSGMSIPVPAIVSASDARSEISAVIANIVRAASDGVPFNRIAVLFNNPEYADRVRSALKLAFIPASGPPPESLSTSSAGRFVSGVLNVALSSLSRKETGDWLATCSVKDPATSQLVPGIEWDRISRTARVTQGAEKWKQQLEQFAKSQEYSADLLRRHEEGNSATAAESLQNSANSAQALAGFVERLAKALALPGETAQWSEWCDWLLQATDRYFYVEADTAEATDRVKSVLERIATLDILGSSPPDLQRFSTVVNRELGDTRSSANRLGNGVFVGNINLAAGTRFDEVHVLGMVDGTFPSPQVADPLLGDAQRTEIKDRFNVDLGVSGVKIDLRRREFLAALSSCSAATLYWSKSSSSGAGEAGPAQWLIEQARRNDGAKNVTGGEFLSSNSSFPWLHRVHHAYDEPFSDSHEYRLASIRHHLSSEVDSAQHWLESDSVIATALLLETSRYQKKISEWSGDLSELSAVVPGLNSELLSASRVETLATCPLRYFFAYILKLDPGVREDNSFHITADRRGSFIHSVLEAYLNLRMERRLRSNKETLEEAIEEVTKEWRTRQSDISGSVWQLDLADIKRQLVRWLRAEAEFEEQGFTPTDAEFSFGRRSASDDEKTVDPLKISLQDSTELLFTGTIDRIDKHEDGTRYIRDYKSGGSRSYSSLKEDIVDRGRHLQLALYSEAIAQLRSDEQSDPVASYWFVMDNKHPVVPDQDDFDYQTARQRLQSVLESLHETTNRGLFPPNPGEPAYTGNGQAFEHCHFCDFARICPTGSKRERMVKIHAQDDRLAPYFDLAQARNGKSE